MLLSSANDPNAMSENTTAVDQQGHSTEMSGDQMTLWPKTLVIRNVISIANLGCQPDLSFIAHRAWNIEYKPKARNALMRIRNPRTAAWINKSGTIFCMGANSMEQSRIATRRYARILQKLGTPVRFLDFKIVSMSATGKIFPVNLVQLYEAHRQHCSYEPALYTWLQYEGIPNVTVRIFASGTVAVVGAKDEPHLYEVFNTIHSMMSCFRRS